MFVCGENCGQRVGSGEDLIGQRKEAAERAPAFGGGIGRPGFRGAVKVLMPAGDVSEESMVVASPAGRFALGFIQPADEVEAVHGGEAGLCLCGGLFDRCEQSVNYWCGQWFP